jgi:ABC-type phosphate transport system substrate-binding protein
MLRRLRPVVLTLFCLSAPGVLAAQDVGYRVIVNATNPVGHLTRDQVSKIFLRRINQWDNHQPVLPVDQTADSPVRRSFTKEIHGRTIAAIQTWWQQQTFAGIGVAPPERASDTDVIEYVRRYPNAIGYVRAGVAVGSDLKIIDVTP